MGRRSKLVLGVGALVAVAGIATAVAALRTPQTSQVGGVTVLMATRDIAVGTTGPNAVNDGSVKAKAVAQMPPGAYTDVSQLSGKVAAGTIPSGKVLTADLFPPAQTRIGTLRIPGDKTALALQMPNVAGVAGFAGAGDKIDIYGVSKLGGSGGGPGARMILQNVDVLNVNGAVLAPTQGQPGGTGLVFLVAVTPAEAEHLVYLTTFEQLYFSLVPKDGSAVSPTPGTGATDSLKLP